MAFAIRMVKLKNYLNEQKHEYNMLYWLELLKATDYLDEKLFNSLYSDAEEIMRMLTASIITVKKRLKK